MNQYKYLDKDLTVKGPVDVSQLPVLGVKENTLVWQEGMLDWVPASTIPEIADAFAAYAMQQAQPQVAGPIQESEPFEQMGPEVQETTEFPIAEEPETQEAPLPPDVASQIPVPPAVVPVAPIVAPPEPINVQGDPSLMHDTPQDYYSQQQINQSTMNQIFPPQPQQPTYGGYNFTPQPPQKNSSNTVLIAIICILATAIIGGLLWFFLGRNTDKADPVQEARRDTVVIHEKETVIERQAPTQPVRVAPANPTTIKVTGTNVCLRLQPYIPSGADKYSNCLKYTNGTNVHPVKGTTLPYKGQEGDFYKTEYQGYTVYISTQFSSAY